MLQLRTYRCIAVNRRFGPCAEPWIGESLLVGKARCGQLTFNAFFFETLNKRDHVALFGLRHLELRQGRGGMTEEHIPVAIADAHASVDEQHVPCTLRVA